MVVEGTRKGDVEGPNPAGYETCDKCLDLLFVWCDFRRVADRWEPPRIKKIAIFLTHFVISENNTPTNHQPTLQIGNF
jgi:hypothetical protein